VVLDSPGGWGRFPRALLAHATDVNIYGGGNTEDMYDMSMLAGATGRVSVSDLYFGDIIPTLITEAGLSLLIHVRSLSVDSYMLRSWACFSKFLRLEELEILMDYCASDEGSRVKLSSTRLRRLVDAPLLTRLTICTDEEREHLQAEVSDKALATLTSISVLRIEGVSGFTGAAFSRLPRLRQLALDRLTLDPGTLSHLRLIDALTLSRCFPPGFGPQHTHAAGQLQVRELTVICGELINAQKVSNLEDFTAGLAQLCRAPRLRRAVLAHMRGVLPPEVEEEPQLLTRHLGLAGAVDVHRLRYPDHARFSEAGGVVYVAGWRDRR
jgi:hypothetical protein